MTIADLLDSEIEAAAIAAGGRRRAPWYVEAFLAFGGWIAGLLAAGAIFALIAAILPGAKNLETAAAIAVFIGAGAVISGAAVGRSRKSEFTRHFAIAAIAAGFTSSVAGAWYLAWYAIEKLSPIEADMIKVGGAGLITTFWLAIAGYVVANAVKDGVLTFLTTLAVYGVATISVLLLQGEQPSMSYAADYVAPIAVLIGLFLFTRPIGRSVHAAAGAALLVGPMIFYETWRGIGLLGLPPAARVEFLAPAAFSAAVVYCLFAIRGRAAPLNLALAAIPLLAGVWLLPTAGAVAIVILCAGFAANHRGLAAVGVAALAWFIGKFYYDLSLSLLVKSAIMAGLGAITLAGALLVSRFGARPEASQEKTSPSRARRPAAAAILFALILAGALGIANLSVWRLEAAFKEARTIYLPLGPQDPRSIIQGDYMVLSFRESIYPPAEVIAELPDRGQILLKLDADSVAEFSRIASPGDSPGDDEIRINYAKTQYGAMTYCPTSFFFQEGEADAYQAARFAVVIVARDGQSRLIELADETRTPIDPVKSRVEPAP